MKKNCKVVVEKEFFLLLKMVVDYVKFEKLECKSCVIKIVKNVLCVGFIGKVNFGVVVWYYVDCLKKCL